MRKGLFRSTYLIVAGLLVLGLVLTLRQSAARHQTRKAAATPGPMLGQGVLNIETPEFTLSLVRSSQTVAALKPKGAGDFDFTPGDLVIWTCGCAAGTPESGRTTRPPSRVPRLLCCRHRKAFSPPRT